MPSAPLHRHYKWELLTLLSFAFFFHQGDRAIFGVVLSGIRADLQLTDSQVGLVGSVLFLTLALMMPLAGYVGDVVSKKWLITCSLVFWSAATLFTGATQGLVGLILLRSVATAGGESFYAPAAYSMLAQFHHRTRALAMSVHQGALYVGVMTSGFLGGWIGQHWGWRSAFYVFGAAGILLGLVFVFRLRDAPTPVREGSEVAGEKASPLIALGLLFRVPTALLLTGAFTAVVFVNNAYVVWAPEFLRGKCELSLTLAGGYAMLAHHLPALGGVLMGGVWSDRWVRTRPTARLEMQATALLLGAPAILWIGLAPGLAGTCAAMAIFGLCRGLCECNTHASLFDVIAPRFRASAVASMVLVAFLVGSTSPWLLGRAREIYGPERGFVYAFVGLAGVYLLGAIGVIVARTVFFQRDRLDDAPTTSL